MLWEVSVSASQENVLQFESKSPIHSQSGIRSFYSELKEKLQSQQGALNEFLTSKINATNEINGEEPIEESEDSE